MGEKKSWDEIAEEAVDASQPAWLGRALGSEVSRRAQCLDSTAKQTTTAGNNEVEEEEGRAGLSLRTAFLARPDTPGSSTLSSRRSAPSTGDSES